MILKENSQALSLNPLITFTERTAGTVGEEADGSLP